MSGKIKMSLIPVLLTLGLAQAGAAFAAERITGTVVDPGAVSGRSATVPFSISLPSSASESSRSCPSAPPSTAHTTSGTGGAGATGAGA